MYPNFIVSDIIIICEVTIDSSSNDYFILTAVSLTAITIANNNDNLLINKQAKL